MARHLGSVPLGLFAHFNYLEQRGLPEDISDLRNHVLIGADRDPEFMAALRALGEGLTRRSFRLRCDSEAAQLAALRGGLGIAVCQTGIAARDTSVVPVLPGQVAFSLDCWLVMHDDLRAVNRVRLVYDHLAGELPRLFGRRPQE